MIVYQVLPRLWGRGRFSDWKVPAFNYVKSLGADCIWYTGIPRHASGKDYVKGDPGSPYSIEDYYDVNPYLADDPDRRLEEFKALVERTHAAGLKVITDLVPNHVSPDCTDVPTLPYCDYDWTDTRKIDYSAPGAWESMKSIALFWAGLGVDGFRCDMAELVPLDFLGWLAAEVRRVHPSFIFIAEVYDKANYRPFLKDAGFNLLYDKSGFYDIARGILTEGRSVCALSSNWQELGDMQDGMLNFLENHDEQRLSSPQFAGTPAKGYAALAFGALFNNASFMVYAGQELGEAAPESADGRTSIFNSVRVATLQDSPLPHSGNPVLQRYRAILAYERIFRGLRNWDLCYCNADSPGFNPDAHFAFVRYGGSGAWAVLCNFSSSPACADICLPPELRSACGKGCPPELRLEAAPWDICIKKFL
ncbi:MAG: hypothetical protein K6F58_04570 [Bacteroidales bacterium]|nr:hypothetical protein [Bacteroidales bacterium]